MTIKELLAAGSGAGGALLVLLEITPIKINPISAALRWLGRALNRETLDRLAKIEKQLAEHIRVDDERDADAHRAQILRFNVELIQRVPHTREDYIEILTVIDGYESYCRDHSEYKNNRAGCAIDNIKRCYNDRLRKRDFAEM